MARLYHGTTTYRLPRIKAGGLRVPGYSQPDASVYFATNPVEACNWARQRCVSDNMPIGTPCAPVLLTVEIPDELVKRDCFFEEHCRVEVGARNIPVENIVKVSRCRKVR